MTTEIFVHSSLKPPGRKAWIRNGDLTSGMRHPLLVFLDGELYLNRVGVLDVLDALESRGLIPAAVSAFVSSESAAARHADYVCDESYARFLAEEVVPLVQSRHGAVEASKTVLAGLSLSGLAAAHAALTTRCVRVAICQSPSFWWEHERAVATIPPVFGASPAFWISVGDSEFSSDVAHPPTGLFQSTSQLTSCARGADALRAAGYPTSYRVFQGGHDPDCWRDDLLQALPWAMSALV